MMFILANVKMPVSVFVLASLYASVCLGLDFRVHVLGYSESNKDIVN